MCQGLKQQLMNSLLFFGIYSLQPLRMFDKSYSFVAFRQYYYYKPAITSIMIERKTSFLSLSPSKHVIGQAKSRRVRKNENKAVFVTPGCVQKKKKKTFFAFFLSRLSYYVSLQYAFANTRLTYFHILTHYKYMFSIVLFQHDTYLYARHFLNNTNL
jgi:hypothetical protein